MKRDRTPCRACGLQPCRFVPYDLAMAAGQDAANRRMRKAGREAWNRADYNEAVRTFNRLHPAPT